MVKETTVGEKVHYECVESCDGVTVDQQYGENAY